MSTSSASATNRGDSCLVVTAGRTVGQAVSEGLRQRGCRVAWLHDGSDSGGSGDEAHAIALGSRADAARGFDDARVRVGQPRLIILSVVPAMLQVSVASDSISEDLWRQGLDAGARAFLYALQAAHGLIAADGGAIVCVGPAFGLVGAAGLLALSTLLESQRALVKSAARQWGSRGIRVHWISIGEADNYAGLAGASLPRTPELGPPPPALGRAPNARSVAAVAHWLASDDAQVLTGSTLVADGGEWMVP